MSYAAVQGTTRIDTGLVSRTVIRLVSGKVCARGSAKEMRQLVKSNGGSKNGWFVYLTNTPINGTIKGTNDNTT